MKELFKSWRKYGNQLLLEQEGEEKVGTVSSDEAGEMISRAYAGGPEGVRAFFNSPEGKDPKVRQVLSHPEAAADGEASDDAISISPTNVNVGGMIPTQKFIDLMKSVAFPLGHAGKLDAAVTSGKGFGPITISGDYIIDGHHRWSGIFAIRPDGTISATDIGFPGDSKQKLAAAQLAIGAIDPNVNDPHPSATGAADQNILGSNGPTIKKLIEKAVALGKDPTDPNAINQGVGPMLNDQMLDTIISTPMTAVLDWASIPEESRQDAEAVKQGIINRTAQNLARMNDFAPGAPPREDMPQFDDDSIGGKKAKKKIYSRLATNRLNIVPPFTKKGGGGEPAADLQEQKLRKTIRSIIKELL
jgi:hypothetical protein